MTATAALKLLGFPMTQGLMGEQAEVGAITSANLICLTRRKLSAIAESDLRLWDEAEAEGECQTAFRRIAAYLNKTSDPVDASMFNSYVSNPSRVMVLPLKEQIERFGRSIAPRMDMSVYVSTFDCPCGSSHTLDDQISILCEGMMRVLALCPTDSSFIFSLKIRTFLAVKFEGLETLCGSRIRTEDERQIVSHIITSMAIRQM